MCLWFPKIPGWKPSVLIHSFTHLHLQWECLFLLCSSDENPSHTCLCSAYHAADTCPRHPWMVGCTLLSE